MKNLFQSVIILCTMAVTSLATAASFTVKETSNSSVFNVHYQNGQKGKVAIAILNNNNEVVYKEEISTKGSFVRPYNFNTMPYGDYTVVIKDESGEYSEKINYTAEELISYTYVAQLPNADNKVWLNVRNNGEESVKVRIFNQNGEVFYEESVLVNGGYNSVFDLNKVKRNQQITIEVIDGNNKTHSVTL